MSELPVLVADIGGSNARFALARRTDEGVDVDSVTVLKAADYADLAAAAEHFLAGAVRVRPRVSSVAVAGPVVGDWAEITNHRSWSFSIAAMRERLGLEKLVVLNDFAAVALSLPVLTMPERQQVGGGVPVPREPMAVLGPGTGLGVSGIIAVGDRWIPIQGEGGHATFAPMSDRESEIAVVLRRRVGHVSWERVLSGPGLINLYETIAKLAGCPPDDVTPDAITARALARSCPMCLEAVEIFCAVLGTAAGNLALVLGARGGVYIAGGIVPRLGDAFNRSAFRARFESKGRLSAYVREVPTYVITAEYPGLIGAAAALAH